jgi:hypothetical protein
MQILIWRPEERFEVATAFQQTGHDERDRPADENENPYNEETAKPDLRKDLPVQEGNGKLNQAECENTQEQKSKFNLCPVNSLSA